MSSSSSLHPRPSRHRRAGLLLAAALISGSAWPASEGLSYAEALGRAAANAPTVVAREQQIAAAREDAVRASALPDPALTVGLSNWPVTGGDAFETRADDMTMKEIGVMQSVPARAKRQARRAVAERKVEQALAASTSERLAVRQATAQAWIDLWAAQQEITALRAQRESADVAVRTARARLEGGTATVSDTLAAEGAMLELENRVDASAARVEAARASLARWVGTPADALEAVGAPPELKALPIDEAQLLESIDRQAPLLSRHSREALAEAEVDAAVADKRPDWAVGLAYGQRDRAPDGSSRSDMVSLEFAMDLPLFTRNRQDAGIAARRAELQALIAEQDDLRRVQEETVRRTLAEWRGLQRQVVRKENEILPLARDRSKAALAAYAGGGDLEPWLNARRDEVALHVEHARHLSELGRLWSALAYLLPDEEMPR
jgi:cobalt-zinc-cadmium efflux system outer membrane protein